MKPFAGREIDLDAEFPDQEIPHAGKIDQGELATGRDIDEEIDIAISPASLRAVEPKMNAASAPRARKASARRVSSKAA